MEHLAPLGAVYQAGTLSGNPVAMAAGIATLDVLARGNVYQRLEKMGADLQARFAASLKKHRIPGTVAREGSILWLCLQEGETPRARALVKDEGAKTYAVIHRELLRKGVWMAPSAFEVAFLSTAHKKADLDKVAQSFDAALTTLVVGGGVK